MKFYSRLFCALLLGIFSNYHQVFAQNASLIQRFGWEIEILAYSDLHAFSDSSDKELKENTQLNKSKYKEKLKKLVGICSILGPENDLLKLVNTIKDQKELTVGGNYAALEILLKYIDSTYTDKYKGENGLSSLGESNQYYIGGLTKKNSSRTGVHSFPYQKYMLALNTVNKLHKFYQADLLNVPQTLKDIYFPPTSPDYLEKREAEEIFISRRSLKNSFFLPLSILIGLLSISGLVALFLGIRQRKEIRKNTDFRRKRLGQSIQMGKEIDFLKANLPKQPSEISIQQKNKGLTEERFIELFEQEMAKVTVEKLNPSSISANESNGDRLGFIPKERNLSIQRFYAPAPRNGVFYTDNLSPHFEVGTHYYEIRITDSGNSEYTLVDNNEARRLAFNIQDDYILPAMDIQGSEIIDPARVQIIEMGELVKEGENWKISKKAVLKS